MENLVLIALWVSIAGAPGELARDGRTPEAAKWDSRGYAATATAGLTLADAVRTALRTDPSVGRAQVARDRAALATLRAQLDRFSVRVNAKIQELWLKTNIAGSREGSREGGLGLSNIAARLDVPVFSGLRVESDVRRRQHLETGAGHDVQEERRGVALAVARAYWRARRLALLREVESQALARLADAEAIAASRVRSGIAPPIDENRAKARRLSQEIALSDFAGQLRGALGVLMTFLGTSGPVMPVDAPVGPRPVPPELVELLRTARGAHPALRSARARIEAQERAVVTALSRYYPQLSAFVFYQHGNNPVVAGADASAVFASANPFKNLAGDLQLGLTLSINLFETLQTYTAAKDARLETARLAHESVRIAREVESGVRVARANVVRLLGLRAQLEEVRALAGDNLAINRRRYENGEAQVFELLDSEIDLLAIERRRTTVATELTLAWLELDASLGEVVGVGT